MKIKPLIIFRPAVRGLILVLLFGTSGCITSSLKNSTTPSRMAPLTGIATSPSLPGKIILSYGYAQYGYSEGSLYSLDEPPLHVSRLSAADGASTKISANPSSVFITDRMKALVAAAPAERLLHPPADLLWITGKCTAVKTNAQRDDTILVHVHERGLSLKVAALTGPDGVSMIDHVELSDDGLLVPVMPSSERRRREAAVAAGLPFAIVADVLLSPLELPLFIIAAGYGDGP